MRSPRAQPLNKYLSLAGAGLQRAVAYRGTILISVLTNLLVALLSYGLWKEVYRGGGVHGGYDWRGMQTYLLMGTLVNGLFNSVTSVYAFARLVRTGDVVLQFLWPSDLMLSQLAVTAGLAVFEAVAAVATVALLSLTVFDLSGPASQLAMLGFLASVTLAALTRFLLNYLVALASFWTMNTFGLASLLVSVSNALSGALVPLALYPPALQFICQLLPFHATVHAPVSIYTGRVGGTELLWTLGQQLGWALVLWIAARKAFGPCRRALEIQGG